MCFIRDGGLHPGLDRKPVHDHPTRFPGRIKTPVTALFAEGPRDSFHIAARNDTVEIGDTLPSVMTVNYYPPQLL